MKKLFIKILVLSLFVVNSFSFSQVYANEEEELDDSEYTIQSSPFIDYSFIGCVEEYRNDSLIVSYGGDDEITTREAAFLVAVAASLATNILINVTSKVYSMVREANYRSGIMNGWLSTNYHGGTGWTFRVDGKPVLSAWRLINGEWYYFNNAGTMYDARYNYRFVAINGRSYQFEVGGQLVKNEGWKRAGEKQDNWAYWIPGNFGAYRDEWAVINGRWYQFKKYLVEHSGWVSNNGKWMYFVPGDYGAYRNTTQIIDGIRYQFDSNGYVM